jgi:hypothetical protein
MASLEGSLAGKPPNIAAFNRVTLAAKRGGVGTFFFCDVRDQIRRTHRLRRKSTDGVGSDTFQDRRTPNRSPRRLSVHLRAALSKIEFGWTPSGPERLAIARSRGVEYPPEVREHFETAPAKFERPLGGVKPVRCDLVREPRVPKLCRNCDTSTSNILVALF